MNKVIILAVFLSLKAFDFSHSTVRRKCTESKSSKHDTKDGVTANKSQFPTINTQN